MTNQTIDGCVFCGRIEREDYEPTRRFDVVMFEPLNPVTQGHRLFVPKRHLESARDSVMETGFVMQAAAAYGSGENADFNLITSSGPAATQTVPHLHVHYVPRHPSDGLSLPWTGQQTEPPPDTSWVTFEDIGHPGKVIGDGNVQISGSHGATITVNGKRVQ